MYVRIFLQVVNVIIHCMYLSCNVIYLFVIQRVIFLFFKESNNQFLNRNLIMNGAFVIHGNFSGLFISVPNLKSLHL